jgi:TonB family protein
VVLDSTVKADGHVDVIRVRRSLGFGLDAAAIAAIDKWTFRPATCDGKSQDTTLNIEVNFKGSR